MADADIYAPLHDDVELVFHPSMLYAPGDPRRFSSPLQTPLPPPPPPPQPRDAADKSNILQNNRHDDKSDDNDSDTTAQPQDKAEPKAAAAQTVPQPARVQDLLISGKVKHHGGILRCTEDRLLLMQKLKGKVFSDTRGSSTTHHTPSHSQTEKKIRPQQEINTKHNKTKRSKRTINNEPWSDEDEYRR